MFRQTAVMLFLIGFTVLCFGQQSNREASLTARDLYLEGFRQPTALADAEKGSLLGLKYSILRRQEDGQFMAVDPQSSFRSGDRIRLSVEVNDAGYLYIVHRGSSGIWKGLFPPKNMPAGDHAVQKGVKYEIPAGLAWAFDQSPGIEKLFIVFSRQPQPSLEELVDSIKGDMDVQPKKPAASPQKELATPGSSQKPGQVDDAFVTQMTQLYSRDLRLDTTYEKESSGKTVPAVYAVNPSGSSDAVVVKGVDLIHE